MVRPRKRRRACEASGISSTVGESAPAPASQAAFQIDHWGAASNFERAIDLTKLPSLLSERIVKRAPFLLGSADSFYDEDFFHEVAGLSKNGKTLLQLTTAETSAVWNEWTKKDNQLYIKDNVSEGKKAQFYALFKQVYGFQADNNQFGLGFCKAASYFLSDTNPRLINWASHAAELSAARRRSTNNPAKACPPCLPQQVQGIVDEFVLELATLQDGSKAAAANPPSTVMPTAYPPTIVSPPDIASAQVDHGLPPAVESRMLLNSDPNAASSSYQRTDASTQTAEDLPTTRVLRPIESPSAESLKQRQRNFGIREMELSLVAEQVSGLLHTLNSFIL
jgi:hypothetical protein